MSFKTLKFYILSPPYSDRHKVWISVIDSSTITSISSVLGFLFVTYWTNSRYRSLVNNSKHLGIGLPSFRKDKKYNLCNTYQMLWCQLCAKDIEFHSYYPSSWSPFTFFHTLEVNVDQKRLPTFFKIYFVFNRRKKLRFETTWEWIYIFEWTIPIRPIIHIKTV